MGEPVAFNDPSRFPPKAVPLSSANKKTAQGKGAENPVAAKDNSHVSASRPVAVPVAQVRHREILNLLYLATGENPFYDKDPKNSNAVIAAFDRALQDDGKIDRGEFEDILDNYYGIGDMTKAWWNAFTGTKDGAVDMKTLAGNLKFFMKFKALTGLSFRYMCGMDEIVIVGGKNLGSPLRNIGIKAILSGPNPEIKDLWQAARAMTGNEETDRTWEWFGTILMTKLFYKLKEAHDFDDLEMKDPLVAQMLGRYAARWALTNEGITDDEWEALEDASDTVKDIKDDYYEGGPMPPADILRGMDADKPIKDNRAVRVGARDYTFTDALDLYREDSQANKQLVMNIISELAKPPRQTAVPQGIAKVDPGRASAVPLEEKSSSAVPLAPKNVDVVK